MLDYYEDNKLMKQVDESKITIELRKQNDNQNVKNFWKGF